MPWPWISRSLHDDVVRKLELRITDLDLERKKAQDELLRVLGGQPYNFPQVGTQTSGIEEPAEADPLDQEGEWLEYLKTNRPAQFPAVLARVMAKRKLGHSTIPIAAKPETKESAGKKAAVVKQFDQAEAEARNHNGNHATAS